MKIRIFLLALALGILGSIPLFSQSADWSSIISVKSYPSPYYNDWERDPSTGNLTLFYRGAAPVQFYFDIRLTNNRYGEVVTGISAKLSMDYGPQTKVYTYGEIIDWKDVKINKTVRDIVARSGKLPEGNYELTIKVVALNKVTVLTEANTNCTIVYPDPPLLVLPADQSAFLQPQPNFVWNLVNTPPDYIINYHIKIVEKQLGQTVLQAITANRPHHEADVIGQGAYHYPPDALPFEAGKEYVWQISAADQEGFPPSTNDGKSEIWSFFFGSNQVSRGFPLDTLQLVENTAYLLNVKSLELVEDLNSYKLDGLTELELRFSDGTRSRITATINNLIVQKGLLNAPVFLGGLITANLSPNDIPQSVRGPYFQPVGLTYNISGSLAITGEVKFPSSLNPFPLTGILSLNHNGLLGTATAITSSFNPLIQFGRDNFKLYITKAVLNFPDLTAELDGDAGLFGSPTNCTLNGMQLLSNGNLSGNVNCALNASIPLLNNSNNVLFSLQSLNGNFTANVNTNNFDYNLTATGGFDIQLNNNALLGADITLGLKPTEVKIISIIPRGNANSAALNLGWANFVFKDFSLSSLAFNAGSWDFTANVNMNYSFSAFSNIQFPSVSGVTISLNGIQLPAINIQDLALPKVNYDSFQFEFNKIKMQPVNIGWDMLKNNSFTGLKFNFDFKFSMPNLPQGTAATLKDPNITITNASFFDGVFSAQFPQFDFPAPGLILQLSPNISFNVYSLLGSLNASWNGNLMELNSNVKVKGKLNLPSAFSCSTGNNSWDLSASAITLSGDGNLTGAINNIIPPCPIKVGLLQASIINSKLTLSISDSKQRIELNGRGNISLQNSLGSPVNANVKVIYEFITNKLIEFSGAISEPFVLDIPPSVPALSFNISSASISENGISINGRQSLKLPDGVNIGVTFDNVKIGFEDFALKSGRILFDAPFSLKGIIRDNTINYSAVAREAVLTEPSGILLNLPNTISIDTSGLTASGSSTVNLKYNSFNLPGLRAELSQNFSMQFNPFKIKNGACEIFSGQTRIALLNSEGFHPELNFFVGGFLPEKIPLPAENIAYLKIKENNNLLIDFTNLNNGLRIFTRPGQPVKLYFPSLKLSKPRVPQVDVVFDVVVDPITKALISGTILAEIPAQQESDFDLSGSNIPFAIKKIFYGNINGLALFQLTGRMILFDNPVGCDSVKINLLPEGRLTGSIDCNINKVIPLISNSDKLNLSLSRITGSFDALLLNNNFEYNLNLPAALRLKYSQTGSYGCSAILHYNNDGLSITDIESDSITAIPFINLSAFQLGLSDFHLNTLNYSKGRGWEFGIDLSVAFNIPKLNLTLPTIRNITLGKSGFTFPQISFPNISDSVHVISGYGLKALAFRMPAITFNWFNYNGSDPGNWNFNFDFDLSFPRFSADVNSSLRFPKISILGAGFTNGIFTGNLELKRFRPGINFSLGGGLNFNILKIGGRLINMNGVQGFDIGFNGNLQLPDPFRCPGDSGIVNTVNTALKIDSSGAITASLQNVVPNCPLDLGYAKLRVVTSSVNLSVTNQGRQSAIMDMTAELRIKSSTPADTIKGTGNLSINLLTGEVTAGNISITTPFNIQIPEDYPLLAFNINRAVFNKDGLLINGVNNLNIAGTSLSALFNNALIDLRNFKVKSGNIQFQNPFALKLNVNGLNWAAAQLNSPIDDNSFLLNLPANLRLDSLGIMLTDTASSKIKWLGREYANLKCGFTNNFTMGFSKFSVKKGKARFILDGRPIAELDSAGFRPSDFLDVIPLPQYLPLGDSTIAYLVLKQGDNLLVNATPVDGGFVISTKPNQPIKLVAPSLKYNSASAPEFNITMQNIKVNTGTKQITEGSIQVNPGGAGQSLLSLSNYGIPLDILLLKYERKNNNYEFTAKAKLRFQNESVLQNLIVNLDTLRLTPNGVTGNVNIGNYSSTFNGQTPYFVINRLGDMARIKVQGVQVAFGRNTIVKFSGDFTTGFFRNGADTAKIHYYSEWNSQTSRFNFALDLSHLRDQTLPILSAKFKPLQIGGNSAINLIFTPNDFELALSGLLTVPALGDSFAVSFSNLKISKDSVSVPDLSITTANQYQKFKLFAAEITLKDLNSPLARAITFAYTNSIFYVSFSGELKFLNAVTEFRNFKVGSDGSVSMGGANLINSRVDIVSPYVGLTRLAINNNKLSVDGFVKLPSPAPATDNTFSFQVNPNGTIIGDAKVVLINDPSSGLDGGDRTEYNFWKATFDPTYACIDFNLNNPAESSFKLVADVYFGNDVNKKISLGNKNTSPIDAGFEVKFDGTRRWGTVSGSFGSLREIGWESLKLNLSNVSLVADTSLNLSLSGSLGVDVTGFSGGINFTNLKIMSDGEVKNLAQSISGGNFAIMNVVTVSVNSISFSPGASSLVIRKGSSPGAGQTAGSRDTTITVQSYFRFGGTVDIANVASGSLEQFLTYTTSNSRSFMIKKASFDIPNIVSFNADFTYFQSASGDYLMRLGGSGELFKKYTAIVAGKVAKISNTTSFGLFVAVGGLDIPIVPGVFLSELGGGFFYNPEQADVDLVKNLAGLDAQVGSKITRSPGSFAVFLYAGAKIVNESLIKGKVLLSVTQNYFTIDGKVILLNQGEKITGIAHLAIEFTNGFAEGNVDLSLQMSNLLQGTGGLSFYVYGTRTWAIVGNLGIELLGGMLHSESDMFIGNSGASLSMAIGYNFDIWLIEIDAGLKGEMWYRSNSWGAYFKTWVSAELFDGIASAKGWFQAGLFGAPNFYVYGVAGLSVSVLCFDWSGSAWGKISSSGFSGGTGSDSNMERLIRDARDVGTQMQETRNTAQREMNAARLNALQISEQQLLDAFNNVTTCGRRWRQGDYLSLEELTQIIYEEKLYGGEPTGQENDLFEFVVFGIWADADAPKPSVKDTLISIKNRVNNSISWQNELRSQFSAQLQNISSSIQPLSSTQFTSTGNPITANYNAPATTTRTGADGKIIKEIVPGTEPGFSYDSLLAVQGINGLANMTAGFSSFNSQMNDRITAIENALNTITQALDGANSASPSTDKVGRKYANIIAGIESYFTSHTKYFKDIIFWAAQKRNELSGKRPENIIRAKTQRIQNDADKRLLARGRYNRLLILSGTDPTNALNNFDRLWPTLTGSQRNLVCDSTGINLWSRMSNVGLTHDIDVSGPACANDNDSLNISLNSLYSPQITYTKYLDSLYDAKIKLAEKLYDILQLYKTWKEKQPDSIKNAAMSLANINTKLAAYSTLLKVPKISSLNYVGVDFKYYSQLAFLWSVEAGSSSVNRDFAINLDGADLFTPAENNYQSIGNLPLLSRYFLPQNPGASLRLGNLSVRVRSGAGYMNKRRISFEAKFSGVSGPENSAWTDGMTTSVLPPTPAVVTLPYLNSLLNEHNYRIYYSSNTNTISAKWSSTDASSGVVEYKYCIGNNWNDSSVVNWRSAGGREEVTITGLNLRHNQTYSINVRAINGDGKISDLRLGAGYCVLKIDTTKPTTPISRQNFQLNEGLSPSPAQSPQNVIPLVELPLEVLISGGYGNNQPLYGELTRLDELPASYGAARPNNPPSLTLNWLPSADNESFVKGYKGRLWTPNQPAADWEDLELNTSFTKSNLNYNDTLNIEVQAVNNANLESNRLTYGPTRMPDPTAPTACNAAYGYGRVPNTGYLIFSRKSSDYETGIKGYQVAIGTTSNNMNKVSWADSAYIAAGSIGNYNQARFPNFNLDDGTYYVRVRAINGQNKPGPFCVTGPLIIDSSPPLTPGAVCSITTNRLAQFKIELNNISDPESGITKIEYCIGSANHRHDIIEWTSVSSDSPIRIPLTQIGYRPNTNYYIGIQVYNSVGAVSQPFWTTFNSNYTP